MIEVKRITLLTRHVDFTIKAKHALERNGIYFVNAFTSVQNMMSFLETNQQDTAILDLTVREVVPDKLIVQIRDLQPNLRIVVSPNHPAVLTALASLNIQGIIDIPMPTRQLLAFMKKMDQSSVAEPRILMPNSADNLDLIEGMDQGATTDQTPPKVESSKNAKELFQRLAAEEPPLPDFEESATIQDVVSNFISLPSAEKLEILLTPDPEITRDATSDEDIRLNLAAQILEAAQDNSTPVNALLTKVKEKLAAEDAEAKSTKEHEEAVVEEDLPALPKVSLEYTAPTTTFSELNQAEEANDLATDRMLPVIRSRPILQGDFPTLYELRSDSEDTSEEDVQAEAPVKESVAVASVEEPTSSEIAQLAIMLTEMSLETAAEALILTRGDEIVGYSGRLPRIEIESLKDIITTGWEPDRKTLLNYVRLESTSMDYLLYSIRTTNDHTLSLLFLGAMPVTAIRRQGRKIADALVAMPHDEDEAAQEDSELIDTKQGERSREERAITLSEKNYPDALHVNLSEAQVSVAEAVISVQDVAAEERLVDEDNEEYEGDYDDESVELAFADASITTEPEVLVAYNFVWILRDATQPLTNEAAQALIGSLNTILSGRTWRIRNLDVYGDFVYLRADVPQSQAANKAVREAMRASAEALQPTTPAWAKDLWADSYLVVPSERELQLDEIQEFIQFARS